MTTQFQKQREMMYANKAGELLRVSWEVEIAPDETDWPDLIINEESLNFGLEVREIYKDEAPKGSAKKAEETHNRRHISELAKAYYKKTTIPIEVDLLGDMSRQKEILAVLTNASDQLCVFEQARIEPYDGCAVYITKLPEQFYEYNKWTYVSDHAGWVATLDKSLLERTIALKAKKLSKYRTHIANVRLLVVSDRIYNSGRAQLDNTIKCDPKGFNAVYYLSYPEAAWKINS